MFFATSARDRTNRRPNRRIVRAAAVLGLLTGLIVPPASAQQSTGPTQTTSQTTDDDGTVRLRLPTVTVTAQKEPETVQDVPVSVTAVTEQTLEDAGINSVSDAAQYAPNTFFNEFTARKLSNPRFRGVGSSPGNPGVTTYIDGVPQLNANSSSIELLDVSQIEFVRGPQSALFGRNTLGGLVNITSARPSFRNWSGRVVGPYGNFSSGSLQASASGPLVADKLALGVGIGYSGREGYTVNDVTGHDLDSRSAVFGKAQVLWTAGAAWTVRGIFSAERARDGDYALNDLGALRSNSFHVSRDFEGFTHRDLVTPTLHVGRTGRTVDFSSVTGFVWWKTEDLTDLDYLPLPLITRSNNEKDHQFTQEFRVASAKNAAIRLSDGVTLRWQGGLFLFTQNYNQDAINTFSPYVLSLLVPVEVSQHSPQSELDDKGFGLYGRGTFTVRNLDLTIGLRADHESKKADLNTFFAPALFQGTTVHAERGFTAASPQFTVAYRVVSSKSVYFTAARGFKAGGFNPSSPPGSEAYGEEHSWNYEGGVKTSWWGERFSANGAVFYIDWSNLQVNVPNPFVPAQFYISNAGGASSKGFELELSARPMSGVDLFGSLGYANARFGDEGVSGGVSVAGNRVSNSPEYTTNVGAQYSRALRRDVNLRVRAELVRYGDLQYDDANTAGQPAYSLTHLRAGVHGARLFGEAWMRNAFDTRYVPTAFAFPGLTPSGFIGELGAPRTFGVRAGVTF
jgi:iron complex outermembrane receptor protein